jgi:putative molybdopterin biosynthesis protein
VAESYGLGFTPLGEEHYDFALVSARRTNPAVVAFLKLLAEPATQVALRALGFRPAREP